MEKDLNYTKVREVKNPEYGTPGAAGIDLFVPELNPKTFKDIYDNPQNLGQIKLGRLMLRDTDILLRPQGRVIIPSGIKVNLEKLARDMELPKYMDLSLQVKNKSGVSTKKGLDRLAELIDSDYQGEIGISIVNTSAMEYPITSGEKIVQMVITPIVKVELCQVGEKDLFKTKTKRGDKGFGKGSGK